MIELDQSLLIGEGSHRATYRHPDDPTLCLKVVKPGTLEARRKNNKKWYKRLRKLESFDETHKEIEAYATFGNNPRKYLHVPRFHGMSETSLGPGMLLDRVMNEDGSPARTLDKHLDSGENRDRLRRALFEFERDLVAEYIVVRDFTIRDVIVSERQDGEHRLFIIDGLGGKEFIPLSAIPWIARRKATRRIERFFDKIMQKHPDFDLITEGAR